MKNQLTGRLTELKQEYELGKQQMAQLDATREELHAQILRISGAIQVLEEELQKALAGEAAGHAKPVVKVA